MYSCQYIHVFNCPVTQSSTRKKKKKHDYLLFSINKILIPESITVKQLQFFTKYFKIPAKLLTFIFEKMASQKYKWQFLFQEFSLDCLNESYLTAKFSFLFQGRQLQLCSTENCRKRYEGFLLPWKQSICKHRMEKLTFFCDLCPNVRTGSFIFQILSQCKNRIKLRVPMVHICIGYLLRIRIWFLRPKSSK